MGKQQTRPPGEPDNDLGLVGSALQRTPPGVSPVQASDAASVAAPVTETLKPGAPTEAAKKEEVAAARREELSPFTAIAATEQEWEKLNARKEPFVKPEETTLFGAVNQFVDNQIKDNAGQIKNRVQALFLQETGRPVFFEEGPDGSQSIQIEDLKEGDEDRIRSLIAQEINTLGDNAVSVALSSLGDDKFFMGESGPMVYDRLNNRFSPLKNALAFIATNNSYKEFFPDYLTPEGAQLRALSILESGQTPYLLYGQDIKTFQEDAKQRGTILDPTMQPSETVQRIISALSRVPGGSALSSAIEVGSQGGASAGRAGGSLLLSAISEANRFFGLDADDSGKYYRQSLSDQQASRFMQEGVEVERDPVGRPFINHYVLPYPEFEPEPTWDVPEQAAGGGMPRLFGPEWWQDQEGNLHTYDKDAYNKEVNRRQSASYTLKRDRRRNETTQKSIDFIRRNLPTYVGYDGSAQDVMFAGLGSMIPFIAVSSVGTPAAGVAAAGALGGLAEAGAMRQEAMASQDPYFQSLSPEEKLNQINAAVATSAVIGLTEAIPLKGLARSMFGGRSAMASSLNRALSSPSTRFKRAVNNTVAAAANLKNRSIRGSLNEAILKETTDILNNSVREAAQEMFVELGNDLALSGFINKASDEPIDFDALFAAGLGGAFASGVLAGSASAYRLARRKSTRDRSERTLRDIRKMFASLTETEKGEFLDALKVAGRKGETELDKVVTMDDAEFIARFVSLKTILEMNDSEWNEWLANNKAPERTPTVAEQADSGVVPPPPRGGDMGYGRQEGVRQTYAQTTQQAYDLQALLDSSPSEQQATVAKRDIDRVEDPSILQEAYNVALDEMWQAHTQKQPDAQGFVAILNRMANLGVPINRIDVDPLFDEYDDLRNQFATEDPVALYEAITEWISEKATLLRAAYKAPEPSKTRVPVVEYTDAAPTLVDRPDPLTGTPTREDELITQRMRAQTRPQPREATPPRTETEQPEAPSPVESFQVGSMVFDNPADYHEWTQGVLATYGSLKQAETFPMEAGQAALEPIDLMNRTRPKRPFPMETGQSVKSLLDFMGRAEQEGVPVNEETIDELVESFDAASQAENQQDGFDGMIDELSSKYAPKVETETEGDLDNRGISEEEAVPEILRDGTTDAYLSSFTDEQADETTLKEPC